MNKADEIKIKAFELSDVETTIKNKIRKFVNKYNQYPRYLKLPLFISNQLKRNMIYIAPLKLDYNSEQLKYRDLIVCETISITELKEIEVF